MRGLFSSVARKMVAPLGFCALVACDGGSMSRLTGPLFPQSSGIATQQDVTEDAPGEAPETMCYTPYRVTIEGWLHFAYWLTYRPNPYIVNVNGHPVGADPIGANGVLIQKRDICAYCGCNPLGCMPTIKVCGR